MSIKFLKSVAVFSRELFTNPGATGAACPSSLWLGQRMASFIPKDYDGLVVELGAGTGAITNELLDRGIAPNNLISIEMSASLSTYLQHRFPNVRVIQGDAEELQQIIDQSTGRPNTSVDYIVSSLPFRSLPREVCQKIAQQITQILTSAGRLIQFTYHLRSKNFTPFNGFTSLRSKIVWANIPPARVDLYAVKA